MVLVKRSLLFLGLIGLSHAPCNTMEKPKEVDDAKKNVFDLIKEQHAPALAKDRLKVPFAYKRTNEDGTLRQPTPGEMWQSIYEGQLYKPYSAQFSKACDVLKDSGYFSANSELMAIDPATRLDLKILLGGPGIEDQPDCLVNKINKTNTFAGRSVLCAQLARPMASTEQLVARNLKINTFVRLQQDADSAPKFNSLDAQTKNAASGESAFLTFFDSGDPFEQYLIRSRRHILGSGRVAWIKKMENWLNENPVYLYYQEASPILMNAPGLVIGGASKALDFGKIVLSKNIFNINEYMNFFKTIGFNAINSNDKKVIDAAAKLNCPGAFVKFLKLAFGAKGLEEQATGYYNTGFAINFAVQRLKFMRKKLHHTAKIMRAFKETQTTLQQLSASHNGKMLVDLQLPQSDKAKRMLQLLSSATFDKDHNDLWLVDWGKIKLAYKLMCETKDEFRKPYAALGMLDYLMGSARLIINSPGPIIRGSTQKAKYTVSTFIRDSQTPALQATKCWSPFIKTGEECVLNSASLAEADGKKMLIITGPNRQGKTVFMLMLLYAALMSQALGVVPAEGFSQTPYNHLITFIKTETNTSKGESLFVNTCGRGGVVIDTLKKGSGLKLFGTDEPFGGTKHGLAQSVGYEFIKEVGEIPKVNGMITTHLKSVTRLPASYPIHFMNLKVNNHHVEPGIGYCETEDEGLKVIEEKLGKPFAEAVKKNLQHQTVHEYLENQTNLDRLVQEARQEYQALRQKVGVPTLDGMIINLTDPQLHAEWEQKINNPPIAEIRAIANRLKIDQFERFFDLLARVAMVGQLHPETQHQTFKDLMLTIMAHCADATDAAHSAPWLERIRHIEATIAQEHERRATLQQEINALLSVRNQQPLAEQLQTERHTLTALTAQKENALEDLQDVQDELNLMQRARQLQGALEQQNQEFFEVIEQTRRDLQALRIQPNAHVIPPMNN